MAVAEISSSLREGIGP